MSCKITSTIPEKAAFVEIAHAPMSKQSLAVILGDILAMSEQLLPAVKKLRQFVCPSFEDVKRPPEEKPNPRCAGLPVPK